MGGGPPSTVKSNPLQAPSAPAGPPPTLALPLRGGGDKAALAALLLALFAATATADWPVFRGDAAMTGVAPAATPALPDQLSEVWTTQCGDGIDATPVVAAGTVYVASLDRSLYALSESDGKLKWKTPLGVLRAPPAVRGNRVYVGDMEGKFYALDAATGAKVWTFETQGEIHAGANFVGDDILIGSHDSTLYRLNPEGKKVWEFKIDGPINGAASVVGNSTFVAGCDSILHVLDVATGKEQRQCDLGGQAGATAAVGPELAYVGTMTNQVLAIDHKQGKRVWMFEAKRRQQPFYSSAAVTPGAILVGSRDKKLYALDPLTGAEKWAVALDGNVDASPLVVGTRVYVGSQSSTGEFYALNLADGRIAQQLSLGAPVTASAALAEGGLVVGTDKGVVVKLGRAK